MDLGITSLFVDKVDYFSGLTGVSADYILSRWTLRPEYEHKHRGNRARKFYKGISP